MEKMFAEFLPTGYLKYLGTMGTDIAVEVDVPDDMDYEYMSSYRNQDGVLVLDTTEKLKIQETQNNQIEGSRQKAEAEELRSNLLLKNATRDMSDEELYTYEYAHEAWRVGGRYLQGQVLLYAADGNLYKCQQSLDARAEHPPGSPGTEALYAPVPRPNTSGGVLPWVYNEEVHPGDQREYEGAVYERLIAWNAGTNIWEPSAAPTVWRKVVENELL